MIYNIFHIKTNYFLYPTDNERNLGDILDNIVNIILLVRIAKYGAIRNEIKALIFDLCETKFTIEINACVGYI
jgi:hypothetical protein